jgi:hypothetical protein
MLFPVEIPISSAGFLSPKSPKGPLSDTRLPSGTWQLVCRWRRAKNNPVIREIAGRYAPARDHLYAFEF